MFAFVLLLICASACALPSTESNDAGKILQSSKELTFSSPGRGPEVVGIVGGNETTIEVHPYTAVLFNLGSIACCGTIINNRSVLTAGHCIYIAQDMSFRVGSSMASSGGTVYSVDSAILHPEYDHPAFSNDIAIVRSATKIVYNANVVQPAVIAGADYNLPDNEKVWAVGWGVTKDGGHLSEHLRHVEIWTINQKICYEQYRKDNMSITEKMLCSGVLHVGGKGTCHGDSGGPLVHNGVVVGVCSFANGCASKEFPDVSTRVSSYADWIEKNK